MAVAKYIIMDEDSDQTESRTGLKSALCSLNYQWIGYDNDSIPLDKEHKFGRTKFHDQIMRAAYPSQIESFSNREVL